MMAVDQICWVLRRWVNLPPTVPAFLTFHPCSLSPFSTIVLSQTTFARSGFTRLFSLFSFLFTFLFTFPPQSHAQERKRRGGEYLASSATFTFTSHHHVSSTPVDFIFHSLNHPSRSFVSCTVSPTSSTTHWSRCAIKNSSCLATVSPPGLTHCVSAMQASHLETLTMTATWIIRRATATVIVTVTVTGPSHLDLLHLSVLVLRRRFRCPVLGC